MTVDERLAALEEKLANLGVSTLADDGPSGYYTSVYSGEQIDQSVAAILEGNIVLPSSTSGSDKKFRLTVDDSDTVMATEVTGT